MIFLKNEEICRTKKCNTWMAHRTLAKSASPCILYFSQLCQELPVNAWQLLRFLPRVHHIRQSPYLLCIHLYPAHLVSAQIMLLLSSGL